MPSDVESPMWTTERQDVRGREGEPEAGAAPAGSPPVGAPAAPVPVAPAPVAPAPVALPTSRLSPVPGGAKMAGRAASGIAPASATEARASVPAAAPAPIQA